MSEGYKCSRVDEKGAKNVDYVIIEKTGPIFPLGQKTRLQPSLFTRLLLYLLIGTLIVETCVLLSLKGYAKIIFEEDSLVECFQLGILLVISLLMYRASKKYPTLAEVFHVFMILPLIAAARELDSYFENLIAEATWFILVSILASYLVFYFWKRFHTIKKQLQKFMRTNSFGFMFSGFFFVMVFARLFGQKVLWKTMLGENYVRLAVRATEESCELVGYIFILAGAIECLFQIHDKHGGSSETECRLDSSVT